MSFKKQVASGVKWTTIGTVVIALSALLKISILTRFLDKEDFGLMAILTFIIGFMNLFNDMGLTSAILHKRNISKEEYGSLYWLNLFISAVIFSVLCLLATFVSSFYKQPELEILIPLLGLNLLFSGVGMMFKTIEQKNLLFREITIIEIIGAVFSLGCAVILAMNDFGIYSLVYSALLQFIINNLFYFVLGIKKYGLLFHFNFSDTRPFLKIGIYQVGGQAINYFNRDLDILIIGKMFSPELLGGYSLAKQLVTRPMQILNPIISKVAAPTLAKFQDNIQNLKRNYLKLINVIAALNIPVYILVIIFAPWIIELLYGSGFDDITSLVRILSIYMIIRSVSSPVGSLVIATGRTDLEFYWNICTILVTPLCIYIGAQFGIVGAAAGITASILLLFIPSWKILINNITGVSFIEYSKAILHLRYRTLINSLK